MVYLQAEFSIHSLKVCFINRNNLEQGDKKRLKLGLQVKSDLPEWILIFSALTNFPFGTFCQFLFFFNDYNIFLIFSILLVRFYLDHITFPM